MRAATTTSTRGIFVAKTLETLATISPKIVFTVEVDIGKKVNCQKTLHDLS